MLNSQWLITYHFDYVASLLDKFQHVTNQLACIVRCFLDLEFIKVMLCIDALLVLSCTGLLSPNGDNKAYLFITIYTMSLENVEFFVLIIFNTYKMIF